MRNGLALACFASIISVACGSDFFVGPHDCSDGGAGAGMCASGGAGGTSDGASAQLVGGMAGVGAAGGHADGGAGTGGASNDGSGGAAGQSRVAGGSAGSAGTGGENAAQAVTLASGQKGIVSLAVDGFDVYWILKDGTVMSAPKDGSGEAKVLSTGASRYSLRVDDLYLYWLEDADLPTGSIVKMPKSGGSTLVIGKQDFLVSIQLGQRDVYFSVAQGPDAIISVPKSGGDFNDASTDTYSISDFAVSSADIIWIGATAQDSLNKMPEILTAPVPFGGDARVIVSGDVGSTFSGLTYDEKYVYWGNQKTPTSSFALARCDFSGKNCGEITPEQDDAFLFGTLFADNDGVYWATAGTIREYSKASATDRTVATVPTNDTFAMVLDDSSIYWARGTADGIDGTIQKIAK